MAPTFEPKLKLEHSDSRGEIYSVSLPDEQELMLLHSKKGSLRGGHAHDVSEVVILLTGKMLYHKTIKVKGITVESQEYKEADTELIKELNSGDVSFNPAYEPHMGEFLEDSWLLEWKINTKKGDWTNIDDPSYRAQVKASIAV